MDRITRQIDFKTLNDHLTCEFKDVFTDIVNQERKLKKIRLDNLCRCMKSLGYEYPILRILNKSIDNSVVPIDYYIAMLLIVGIEIRLIPNASEYSKRNIKNRDRLLKSLNNKI